MQTFIISLTFFRYFFYQYKVIKKYCVCNLFQTDRIVKFKYSLKIRIVQQTQMHCLYLDIVDFLQSKVRQSEDDVHAPQGELGDWIAVQVNVQIIQSPYPRERVNLNQGADVGRTECDGLQQQEIM